MSGPIELSIDAPDSVMPAAKFKIVGWLRRLRIGLSNETVVLQHSIGGRIWSDESSTTTLSDGIYYFRRSEAKEGEVHHYRVKWEGTTSIAPITSRAVLVHVVRALTRLTADSRPGVYDVGQAFSVTGTLNEVYSSGRIRGLTGMRVTLYEYAPTTGDLTPLDKATTDTSGNYTCQVDSKAEQDFYWYVCAFAGVPNQYFAALSEPLAVIVGYGLV